jgi:GAF domain
MELARLAAVFAGLHGPRPGAELVGTRLCLACVDVVGVSGAGILLVDTDGGSSSFGTSEATPVDVVEDLQFTLGEGPGLDAHASGRPVLEPDLARPSTVRWTAFAAAAVRAGVRGVFSFPLRAGPTRIGALDLSCTQPGSLTPQQQRDASAMTDVVTQTLLAAQAEARPGGLAPDFDDTRSLRLEVHQAAGMLSEQLDVRAADALVLLRAHAYATERGIDVLARDIVTRKLRIDGHLDGGG